MYQIIALLLCLSCALAQPRSYIGKILPSEASGAKGSFQVDLGYDPPGTAYYEFELDLSQMQGVPATCDLSLGLTYHIHSFWNNATSHSGAVVGCGGPVTGGHYDPTLACGPKSEEIAGSCAKLGRVAPAYTYACNVTAEYSCEVGDLSGKMGVAAPTSAGFFEGTGVDTFGPSSIYYKAAGVNSNQWASVVFHCRDAAGTRLVCADLVLEA